MPWMASQPPSLCVQRVGLPHVLCTGLLSSSGSMSTPHLVLGDRNQLFCCPQALLWVCAAHVVRAQVCRLPGISWSLLACRGGGIGGLLGAVSFLDSAGIIFRLADGGGGGCRWYY